jgi:hypothetical protein
VGHGQLRRLTASSLFYEASRRVAMPPDRW